MIFGACFNACAYDTHFEDCAVRCTTDMECPVDLTCEAEGLCRTPGATEACTAVLEEILPSCVGLAATCGPNANEDCCSTATPIPGGTFFRSYDVASDGMYPSTAYPATVSSFVLDRFEVTVGRFRKLVEAGMGTQASAPATGAGARSLNGLEGQGGWDASWNTSLATDIAALVAAVKCSAAYQAWTDMPTGNGSENRPINCINWYEALAFCVWDGGYLPSDAEWNYAASGGDEHRAFPWSSPPNSLAVDCSYANYYPSNSPCAGTTNNVGSESPKGDGRWGQSDLGGNVREWMLDWYAPSYVNPCTDCATLTPAATSQSRMMRGGGLFQPASSLRVSYRISQGPLGRDSGVGLRCARSAS